MADLGNHFTPSSSVHVPLAIQDETWRERICDSRNSGRARAVGPKSHHLSVLIRSPRARLRCGKQWDELSGIVTKPTVQVKFNLPVARPVETRQIPADCVDPTSAD